MDFLIGLPLLIDNKGDNYDAILVVADYLTKIVYYEPIKTIINVASLAKVIFNIIVRHHDLRKSIISDQGSFFTSKIWFSL